jgi:hypothetical protein
MLTKLLIATQLPHPQQRKIYMTPSPQRTVPLPITMTGAQGSLLSSVTVGRSRPMHSKTRCSFWHHADTAVSRMTDAVMADRASGFRCRTHGARGKDAAPCRWIAGKNIRPAARNLFLRGRRYGLGMTHHSHQALQVKHLHEADVDRDSGVDDYASHQDDHFVECLIEVKKLPPRRHFLDVIRMRILTSSDHRSFRLFRSERGG